MRTLISFLTVLFLVSTFNITTACAQDTPRWGLPDDARARLGKGTISEIAYSPDGSLLAVGGSVGIWVYDANTGAEVALIGGYTGWVRSIAFSPDGNTIVSGGQDKTVRLWDVATGNLINTLEHGRRHNHVYSVAYSPDGTTLASGGSDGTVSLWDTATGNLRNTLSHGGEVNSVAFSPDGTTLASGSRDYTVRLWDVATGNLIKTLTGHPNYVESVAFSPDGITLASGGWYDAVRLWNVATGNLIKTLDVGGVVRSVAFSPDGSTLASGSDDRVVRLWDVATGDLIHTLGLGTRSTPTLPLTYEVLSVAFSPDGTTLAGGSGHPGTIKAGGSINSYIVRLWDADTGNLRNTLTGHTGDVLSVAFSPDGTTLASGSWQGGVLRLWDTATGNRTKILARDGDNQIWSVVYSPDGNTIAGGSVGEVLLWDANTGNLRNTLEHRGSVPSVAFSLDGTTLASGSWREVHLWDVATATLRNTLTGHTGDVLSVAFSPNGSTLASGGRDGLYLWDTNTGNRIKTFETNFVDSLAFSPDGTTLASGGRDGLYLWDTNTGNRIKTLRTGTANSLAFSPDSTTLASGRDNTVSLWDTNTGNRIKSFIGHIDSVNSIAYSPDGTTLASGSEDGTVLLWELTPTTAPPLTLSPNTVADQTFEVGTAVNLTLPSATGGTAPYTYTLSPIPIGLQFDTATQLLSGTPTTATPATSVTYTATDATEASASLTFTITVEAGVLPLDVNADGKVDVLDLVWVAVSYQMRGDGLRADVNADGVVNVQDLVAVAGGIDAGAVLSAKIAEEVLLAAEAAEIDGVAGAPVMGFSSRSKVVSGLTAHRNVAAALSDVRSLAASDARLVKWMPLLEKLLQALAEMGAIPETTALLPNYPNPFNPETWIPYHLSIDAEVTVTIYDVRGSVVRELLLGHQPSGVYESRGRAAYWNGRNDLGEPVASGLYFYTLTAGDFTATRKLSIAK